MTTPSNSGHAPAGHPSGFASQYQPPPWYQGAPANTGNGIPWHSVYPAASSAGPPLPRYASWLQRAGAFLLDLAINYGPLWLLIGIGTEIDDRSSGDTGEIVGAVLGWVALLLMISTLAFQVIREGRTGQTLGKKVLGIRAIRDRDGLALGAGLTLGRRLLQLVVNFPVFGLGWWWAMGDDKRQTFADKITGVIVVRADAMPVAQAAALRH